ncbi:MAG TPA: peroxiredoxin [Burkholderiales bacterium]|nr:peroxiredoxin [Burkholderiales bacterium]
MLREGDPAPDFDLPDADMNMVSLASFRNSRNVVLYFYPKDDNPGCTLEAIEFSDLEDEFTALDAAVIGVSMDDCLCHASFRDKHGITVQLLADTEGETCAQYGVLHEKVVEGKTKTCIVRSTFVINKDGVLVHVMYGVSARNHAATVLSLVRQLKSAATAT